MNNSDRVLKVFKKEPVDKIVWQPRLEHWYDVNKLSGTLPPKYRDKDLLEICDNLGTSPRTYYFYDRTIRCIQNGDVKVETTEDSQNIISVYSTPKGKLREVKRKVIRGLATDAVAPYWTEYMVKGIQDFEALKYILDNQIFDFDRELYKELDARIDGRAAATVNLPHAPFAKIIIVYAGFERASLMILKRENEVRGLIQTLEENNDKRIAVIKKSPIPIVNFSDNIDQDLFPRPLFTKYLLPYYQKRTHKLHASGKFCTSHWDGKVKSLLQYARETGLDGLECVTPKPQGDVTLKEIRIALGNMVLLDGIPAISFLPWASDNELEKIATEVLETFSPRLILGVSDLVPPNANIEKIRLVTRIVEKFQP